MLLALIVEEVVIWLNERLLWLNAKPVKAKGLSLKNVHDAMEKDAIHVRLVKAMVMFEKNVPVPMGLA
jgi:hypothetical protein